MNLSWLLGGCLLLGFFLGWRKGFLRIISGIAGLMLQLYVAFHFRGSLGEIIEESFDFTSHVSSFLAEHLPVAEFVSVLPIEYLPQSAVHTAGDFISAPYHTISGLVLSILSFAALFFITKLIFSFISCFLTRCLDHTFIGPLNRFLGGVLGALSVSLVVGISLLALSSVFGDWDLPGSSLGSFTSMINQSEIAEFMLNLF